MSSKISTEGETGNSTNHDLKGTSSSSPTVPILNIPRRTSSSISPSQVVSSSNDAAAHDKAIEEPEVMVLDDDDDMDQEADGDGDGGVDDSFGSVGPDDGKSGMGGGKLTLKLLLDNGLIEAGSGVMSIDYLGQTFKGDLLPNGQIKSQETGLFFKNPSAWAIYCKKIVNPSKKSGCGWASVKYKGRKMDHFKAVWSSKMKAAKLTESVQRPDMDEGNSNSSEIEVIQEIRNCDSTLAPPMPSLPGGPLILRHSLLGPKHADDNKDTLIEVESFVSVGKVQPFNVSISSSALLLVDLHAHLSPEPVCGYLAGHWDLNAHNLAITHCYPCMTPLEDGKSPENEQQDSTTKSKKAQEVESEIYNSIYTKHLTLVGWYRSKPAGTRALPSLRDSEAQLDHQIKLLGSSDATYSPCIGMIISPYTSGSTESELLTYWTVPPPENGHAQEYGKPLKMSHAIVTDPCLSTEVLQQVEECIMFYKDQKKTVKFKDNYNSDTLFITKMGRTLLPKFPRDQDERLWKYIRVLLLGEGDDADIDDPLLIRPPPMMTTHDTSSNTASLASMTLNGGASVSANGNNIMATAGVIGPRHTNDKTAPLNVPSNSSKSKAPSSRRKTHDSLEEEEIDDDEESAILIGSGRDSEERNSLSLSSMPSSLTIEKYNGSSQQSNLSIHSLTSLPQGTSISSNLTSTPVSITPSSSFKSPNPNSTLSGKNTKNESSSSFTSDEVSFLLQKPGSSTSTPRLPASVSITKTSKGIRAPAEAIHNKKTQRSPKQKTSPTPNPFNITTSSKSTSGSSPNVKDAVLSPNNSTYNRGAVEDSDEESLVIHE